MINSPEDEVEDEAEEEDRLNEDDEEEELKREEEEHEDIYSDDMSGWRISAPLRTQPGASRRVCRQQDYLTLPESWRPRNSGSGVPMRFGFLATCPAENLALG